VAADSSPAFSGGPPGRPVERAWLLRRREATGRVRMEYDENRIEPVSCVMGGKGG
jgi:hypothetical protein